MGSHECRDEASRITEGEIAFAEDRNGIKWKCVSRRELRSQPGTTWACIELDCRKKTHGLLAHGFHYDMDCEEPYVVTTVDGAEVPDAPRNAEEYTPLEGMS